MPAETTSDASSRPAISSSRRKLMTVVTPLERIEAHWEGAGWPEVNRPLVTACSGTSSDDAADAAPACRLAGCVEAQPTRAARRPAAWSGPGCDRRCGMVWTSCVQKYGCAADAAISGAPSWSLLVQQLVRPIRRPLPQRWKWPGQTLLQIRAGYRGCTDLF